MTTHVFAGDSMTDGLSGLDGKIMWPYQLAALTHNPKMINLAVGGQGVADQVNVILGHPPTDGEHYFIFLGNVDQIWSGASAGALDRFAGILDAVISFWGTNILPASLWSAHGNWVPFIPWASLSRYTQTQGDWLEGTFDGDEAQLAYTWIDGLVSTFNVSVDGVVVASLSTVPPAPIISGNPNPVAWFSPTLKRFTGFGPGSHTLRVTKTCTGPTPIIVLWLGQGDNTSPVHLLTLPNVAAADVQARVDAYNARIRTMPRATVIEAGVNIVPATDLVPGDIHMINQGHAKYAAAVARALSGAC